MMKCELCKVRARIFCESDQASLCWTCDAKVHSANFLVARHSRTLLCRACNSLTPWKATGAALANAVSVCDRCANGERQEQDEESEGGNHVVETDTEDDDKDGVNQVVPWSPSTPPPLPASSSSGSEESVDGDGDGYEQQASATTTTATSLKRQREDNASDRDFQEDSNGEEWREEVAASDGEPPLKGWLRPLELNGSRGCCRDGGASNGV